jgi:hypothetical protein
MLESFRLHRKIRKDTPWSARGISTGSKSINSFCFQYLRMEVFLFLQRILNKDHKDTELAMAKITGNFKLGNEKDNNQNDI